MLKKLLYFFIFSVVTIQARAQSELNLPYLNSVYQSSYINASTLPDHKLSVGIPGLSSIYYGVSNSGFKYFDLERTKDTINLQNFISASEKYNLIHGAANIDLLHVRLRFKENYFFSFHIREMGDVRYSYPKDLLKFLINGNGPYVGQTLDFSGFRLEATHYREYALGFIKKEENLPIVIGGRFKVLQGLSNINLKYKKLTLKTDSDMYELTLSSDGEFNTSTPYYYDDDTSYTVKEGAEYFTNFENVGFAIDLGATYKFNDKITFSGAINNVGFIRWKTNPRNYKVTGANSFSGLDPRDDLYEDDTEFEDYLDSLEQAFEYQETFDSYTNWLTANLYLTASYQLFEKTSLYGTLYLEKYQRLRPAATIAISQKAGRYFQGVLSYSYISRSLKNIGLGLMLKPGPVQFYLATDNILGYINPLGSKVANLRFGINLVFGNIKTADKQPTPEDI